MLRRLPISRLIALCAGVAALAVVGAAAAAGAFGGSGPVPARKSLPVAIHQALTAPAVQGVTGHFQLTNHLIDTSGIHGASPLLTGTTGRFWVSQNSLRLEFPANSDGRSGDTNLVVQGDKVELYDSSSSTVYKGTLPGNATKKTNASKKRDQGPPTVNAIQQELAKLTRRFAVTGPRPGTIAQRPQYTVSIAPRHDGGLLGAVEIGWDAQHGIPLHVSVYAQGSSTPVIELAVTDVKFPKLSALELRARDSRERRARRPARRRGQLPSGRVEGEEAQAGHRTRRGQEGGSVRQRACLARRAPAPGRRAGRLERIPGRTGHLWPGPRRDRGARAAAGREGLAAGSEPRPVRRLLAAADDLDQRSDRH